LTKAAAESRRSFTGGGRGKPSATREVESRWSFTGGGRGKPSATREVESRWSFTGGGRGKPSARRVLFSRVGLPGMGLTELVTGSTISKANSENTHIIATFFIANTSWEQDE
jgi:hypothetical protein